jgi:DNA ligase-1
MNTKEYPLLYKRTKTGAVQTWQIIVEDNTFKAVEGQLGGVLTTSKPTVCRGKNIGRANETSDADQAIAEAEAKMKKKLETGYSLTQDDIDTCRKYFEPMLAEGYTKHKDSIKFGGGVYAQPKLDGMRCICKKDGMWSRNGKPIVSSPHIYEILKPLFDVNPDLVFDGELYTNKFKSDFNAIMSLVKKTKPTEQDIIDSEKSIEYWIYDLPSCDNIFSYRNADLYTIFVKNPDIRKYCKYVQTIKVEGQETLDGFYGKWLEEGYEGQMVRLDKKYENKRTTSLLKRKEFVDAEYTVLDYGEGEGDRTGTLGFICCKTADGTAFRSNIKGSHPYLRRLWKDRDTLVGKSATIKFFNLTPAGVPRFPFAIAFDREAYE